MDKFKAYLLDLDGTIVDSRPGIIRCFRAALAHFGIDEQDENKLNSFIGPPIHVSLSTEYGLNDAQIKESINIYRDNYSKTGILECSLLPKAKECLQTLHNRGARLFLATSKPTVFASQIVKNFGIGEYFEFLMGADMAGLLCEKPAIIQGCLDQLEGVKKSDILMVGDRKYDIIGAKHHGLKCAGVLCGYGTKQELIDFGADYILPNIFSLTE